MEELNLLEVVEDRNEDDVVNVPEYLEIINSPSFELKREKIAVERLLGSGNFCKVYKATLDNDTVAVKSLKGKTLYITSSSLYNDNNNEGVVLSYSYNFLFHMKQEPLLKINKI